MNWLCDACFRKLGKVRLLGKNSMPQPGTCDNCNKPKLVERAKK